MKVPPEKLTAGKTPGSKAPSGSEYPMGKFGGGKVSDKGVKKR